jgi:large subunit ribosomal protein L29
MANIVELRGLSNEKLEEMIEGNREEMFNLRFQKASSRLNNTTRIKAVRREIAQLTTVLANRQLAIDEAAAQAEIASALAGRAYSANATYVYEEQGFQVEFTDGSNTVATALVNLSKKQPNGRRDRAEKAAPERVVRYEVK